MALFNIPNLFSAPSGGGALTFTKGQDAYLDQELGFTRKLLKEDRLKTSITNPTDYIDKRKAKFVEVQKQLREFWNDEYNRQISLGMPYEKAQAEATKATNERKKKLYHYVNEDYPIEMFSDAIKRLKVKASAKEFK